MKCTQVVLRACNAGALYEPTVSVGLPEGEVTFPGSQMKAKNNVLFRKESDETND